MQCSILLKWLITYMLYQLYYVICVHNVYNYINNEVGKVMCSNYIIFGMSLFILFR